MAMASSSTWTVGQNKRFENAVAIFDKDTADYWEKVAMAVGDKTVEDVKMHYDKLVQDVRMIEQDLVPLPIYRDAAPAVAAVTATSKTTKNIIKSKGCKDLQKRMKNLCLQ